MVRFDSSCDRAAIGFQMSGPTLVYFPHNPWPPRTGAHRRCMQTLDGLVQLGAAVHLASTFRFTDTPWTVESIEGLRSRGIKGVWLHKPFRGQGRLERWEIKRKSSY